MRERQHKHRKKDHQPTVRQQHPYSGEAIEEKQLLLQGYLENQCELALASSANGGEELREITADAGEKYHQGTRAKERGRGGRHGKASKKWKSISIPRSDQKVFAKRLSVFTSTSLSDRREGNVKGIFNKSRKSAIIQVSGRSIFMVNSDDENSPGGEEKRAILDQQELEMQEQQQEHEQYSWQAQEEEFDGEYHQFQEQQQLPQVQNYLGEPQDDQFNYSEGVYQFQEENDHHHQAFDSFEPQGGWQQEDGTGLAAAEMYQSPYYLQEMEDSLGYENQVEEAIEEEPVFDVNAYWQSLNEWNAGFL